jgi:flagellar protein FliL
MAETEKENQTPETSAKKKGGKKIIVLLILVIILLGGAGGGFYYWRFVLATTENADKNAKKKQSKKDSAEKDEEKPEGKPEEVNSLKDSLPEDAEVKHIIELQPFIINLADVEQARYLRLSVTLGVGGSDKNASEKPDQLFITRVRNALLAVLGNKKSDEVLSVEGKTKLRRELLKAAQAVSDEPEIHAIYITDFIVQL